VSRALHQCEWGATVVGVRGTRVVALTELLPVHTRNMSDGTALRCEPLLENSTCAGAESTATAAQRRALTWLDQPQWLWGTIQSEEEMAGNMTERMFGVEGRARTGVGMSETCRRSSQGRAGQSQPRDRRCHKGPVLVGAASSQAQLPSEVAPRYRKNHFQSSSLTNEPGV
jgi:hypothetical protein